MGKTRKQNRAKVCKRKSFDELDVLDDPIYCICRSTISDTFMVACDECEEWFHGDCINITPKQAEIIENYYCQTCRDKDSSLQIVTKSDKNTHNRRYKNFRNSDFSPNSDAFDEESRSVLENNSTKKRSRKIVSPKSRLQNQCDLEGEIHDENYDRIPQFGSPSSSYSHSNDHIIFGNGITGARTDRFSPSSAEVSILDDGDLSDHFPRVVHKPKSIRNACNCSGCQRETNCGSCATCRDSRHRSVRSQKCLLRLCNSNSRASIISKNRQKSGINLPEQVLSDFDYESNFDEFSAPRRYISGSVKSTTNNLLNMGSKMRRGDHLPGGQCSPRNLRYSDEPTISYSSSSPRCYPASVSDSNVRASKRNRNYLPPMPSTVNDDNESSVISNRQVLSGDCMDRNGVQPNYESDEDVVLPDLRQCIGPNCVNRTSKSTFCSSGCQFRFEKYNLLYPDHLYCKHHRNNNWHSPNHDNNSAFIMAPTTSIGVSTISPEVFDLYHGFPEGVCASSALRTPLVTNSPGIEYLPYADQSLLTDQIPPGFSRSRQINRLTALSVAQPDFINNQISVFVRNGSDTHQSLHSDQPDNIENLTEHVVHSNNHNGAINNDIRRSHPGFHRVNEKLLSSVASHSVRMPFEMCYDSIDPGNTFTNFQGHDSHSRTPNSRFLNPSAIGISNVGSSGVGSTNGMHITTHDNTELFVIDNATSGIPDSGHNGTVLHNYAHPSMISSMPVTSGPVFRHADEFYMINDNDNIEINWPTSPGSAATISYGTN